MILQIVLILTFSHLCDCFLVRTAAANWDVINITSVAPFTEIDFNGTFTCALNTTYCFTGHYVEEDGWSYNEYHYRFPFFCSNEDVLYHNVRVNYTGGDGFIDSWYDPALEIYHNCTTDGKVRQIFRSFDEVLASGSSYNFTYEQDLFDNGKKHPFHDDYLNITKKWEPYVIDWIYKGKSAYYTKYARDLNLEEMPLIQLFRFLNSL